MKAIHQFSAGFANGDAISNEALAWRDVFRAWGYASEIFSDPACTLPEHRGHILDIARAHSVCRLSDIVLLHFSVGSIVNETFAALSCRKALVYHNVSPADYFRLINPNTAAVLADGHRQLALLANASETNLADSEFNARELRAAGYRNVQVLAPAIGFERLAVPPDRTVLRRFGNGLTNILFVGRCVPNKKIEDLIETFDCFRQTVEPESRLIHVGSFAGVERYYSWLTGMVRRNRMDRVHFAGAVTQPQLNAFYRCADLFLCMSEHEGFCIPLLESFYCDVPVLAYAAGAVPETLGGAGVLFREKNGPAVAEMMGELIRNRHLRSAVLESQRARLARYRARRPEVTMRAALASLLEAHCPTI